MNTAQLNNKSTRGFTLIELLIVIGVIGVLAVALISSLNPLERLRQSRDAERLTTAGELAKAIDRYGVQYGCHPWEATNVQVCNVATGPNGTNAAAAAQAINVAAFTATNFFDNLTITGEIKDSFPDNKRSITTTASELFITESGTARAANYTVCFVPEASKTRSEITTATSRTRTGATGPVCAASYANAATDCHICLP
jgi:prepilin-type N-terminal cleavage/methylation domain-containing protein